MDENKRRIPVAPITEFEKKSTGRSGVFQEGIEGEAASTKPGYSVTRSALTPAIIPSVLPPNVSGAQGSQENEASKGPTVSEPVTRKSKTKITPRLIQEENGRQMARHAGAGCPSSANTPTPPAVTSPRDKRPTAAGSFRNRKKRNRAPPNPPRNRSIATSQDNSCWLRGCILKSAVIGVRSF